MRTLANYVEIVLFKAGAELRAEATRGYLGFVWWFMEPILYMAVFYVIFETGLRHGGTGFVPFLLCGLVAWKWFASTVVAGAGVMASNAAIMQQVYLHKAAFPVVLVAVNTFKFCLAEGLLLLYLAVGPDSTLSTEWLALPALLGVEMLLIISVTVLVAAVVPLIPDLKLLLDNAIALMFFVSGIFFKTAAMSPELQQWLRLNPMLLLIEAHRTVLLDRAPPHWEELVAIALGSLVCLAVGLAVMNRFDRVYPKIVIR